MIDVGSGEMKFFAAQKQMSGFITGKEIGKKDSAVFLETIQNLIVSMDLFWCAENGKKDRPGKDDDKLVAICEELKEYILAGKQMKEQQMKMGTAKGDKVYIFGTEGMRAWRKDMEPKHGGRCTELLKAISEFCSRNFDYDVEFEVISHEEEARCEFEAYKLAQKFADDFPQKYKDASLGNLGWAKGSTQGVIDGQRLEDAQNVLCMVRGEHVAAAVGVTCFARLPSQGMHRGRTYSAGKGLRGGIEALLCGLVCSDLVPARCALFLCALFLSGTQCETHSLTNAGSAYMTADHDLFTLLLGSAAIGPEKADCTTSE